MTRRTLHPGKRMLHAGLLIITGLLLIQGYTLWKLPGSWILAAGQPINDTLFYGLLALLTLVIVIPAMDLMMSWRLPQAQLERQLNHNLSIDKWITVTLTVAHDFPRPVELQLFDHVPDSCDFEGLPATVTVQPGHRSLVSYQLQPRRRGSLTLDRVDVKVTSLWGFWQLQQTHPVATSVKVFPDFASVVDYQLLAVDHQNSQLGIHHKQRRGEGMDFHQLREYRRGDSLRQIDWKATSHRQKLISREYQEERDQQVILLLDGGRRMLTREGKSSHFDHCLNCLLMLSYIALRQGDSVSMMSFGAANRYMSAIKGASNINRLINQFYDFYPDKSAPDYLEAARELMQRHRKRSLVVLTTNLRDEDSDDILNAVKLLKKCHLVLVANLREESLDQTLAQPVHSFDEAVIYAGINDYLHERRQLQKRLQAQGVFFADCTPSQLTAQVINRYLAIKQAGYL
ncbi:DUF58 domain-containing protein [Gynuella sunshinyii]|uniref:Putative conserved protein (Some members containing a von Willebrand factor type A (VWA) domain) n=1 Tax=Gynuella sunshinyii YC6258 TaxID=1445510 RepID=A0A0C5W370_9GAMM|nr:DUF58 domain-containing protein [Gynuella sunshinyii]AJQ97099.1 putative conserved protein (some members containing a von Willebrand factor type A (vWA) domain) [Gynuella sunshinyii YC6258]